MVAPKKRAAPSVGGQGEGKPRSMGGNRVARYEDMAEGGRAYGGGPRAQAPKKRAQGR